MTRAAFLLEQNWNAVPGGTARATNRLIEALTMHSNVTVSGIHGVHRREPRLVLPSVPTVRLPLPGKALTESWSRIGQPRIDRWLDDIDLVHAPAYVLPATDLPVVVTIHDLAFVRHPEWFTPNGVRYFVRFLDRVRDGDATVIVPSSATAEDCLSRGIREDRVHTIPWGIDVEAAAPTAIEEVRRHYDLPETFVLFVGTLEPRKNLATLLEAMRRLDDIPLVVAGPSGWGDVSASGARLLGQVPEDHVEPLMAAATVLVYPSHFEGFGLPVLEAMAQGTAIVTTAETAPAEIAAGGGLAVDTQSATALGDAIEEIVRDGELRARLGKVGRQRSTTYRWDATARAHATIYGRLVR